MALGCVLLVYVGLQYGKMIYGQHHLAQQFEQQQERRSGRAVVNDTAAEIDGLTRLSIPKINLDAIVVEGTSERDLLLGPGHIEDTAELGTNGNAGISGHRDTFFRHIHELDKGDIIELERYGKTFHYEVTGKKIVGPSDISVLRRTSDPELTLVTCYPTYYIGPAPERLVVFSKLVSRKIEAKDQPLVKTAAGNRRQ